MPSIPTLTGTDRLFEFMWERHRVYLRKKKNQPKPWTDDPILQRYRFCNVYRELDTVTKWISDNWRTPHADDPDVWFAMVVARLINWPDTLHEVGYPVPWRAEHFVEVMDDRRQRGQKVYTGAYMVRAEPTYHGTKAAYLAEQVLTPMWADRERLRKIAQGTLASGHRLLMTCRDMGSFMAGQVIADLKYVQPLRSAADWHSWACPGPGSKRGLNRVLDRDVNAPWTDREWLSQLQILHREIKQMMASTKMPELHAQDLQNSLCEHDKAERVRLGQGEPRSRYPGV